MSFYLFPVFMMSFFLGITYIEKARVNESSMESSIQYNSLQGEDFVNYCGAVLTFEQNHPTFTGVVTASNLLAQGSLFATFPGVNMVTPTGVNGRVVTCSAPLSLNAQNAAFSHANGDASYGVSYGGTWLSSQSGSTPQSLASPVPSGNVVFVTQVGN